MNRPAFPREAGDLDAWSVYADYLQTIGDQRGDRIALELALPAVIERDQVRAFQHRAKRFVRAAKTWTATYGLSFARGVSIKAGVMPRTSTRTPEPAPLDGTIANVADFLASDEASAIEELRVAVPGAFDAPNWLRLFLSIPASCRSIELATVTTFGDHAATAIRRVMPAWVRAVAVRVTGVLRHRIQMVIDPTALLAFAGGARFDVLELETIDDVTLAKLLASSPAMHVRLDIATGAQLAHPRVELGRPGDAALISPQHGRAIAVRRWHLADLQERYGVIPIRAQLACALPESHVLRGPTMLGLADLDGAGVLMSRGNTWHVRAYDRPLFVRGRVIAPDSSADLEDGDGLGDGWMFAARDATAAARALLV